jgi:hypothetical protein
MRARKKEQNAIIEKVRWRMKYRANSGRQFEMPDLKKRLMFECGRITVQKTKRSKKKAIKKETTKEFMA